MEIGILEKTALQILPKFVANGRFSSIEMRYIAVIDKSSQKIWNEKISIQDILSIEITLIKSQPQTCVSEKVQIFFESNGTKNGRETCNAHVCV